MASAVVALPPRSARAQAVGQRTIDGRFYRRRLAPPATIRGGASSPPTGTSPADWPSPVPAMSGRRAVHRLEQPGPSAPERRARQHADRAGQHRRLVAEDVAEHVLGEDHVEVRAGAETSCIAALSTSRCSSSMFGNSALWTSRTTSRHSRLGLEHVRLVDARHPASGRRRSRPGRCARSPRRVYTQSSEARSAVPRLLAEVDPAGQLAHDEQVGAAR